MVAIGLGKGLSTDRVEGMADKVCKRFAMATTLMGGITALHAFIANLHFTENGLSWSERQDYTWGKGTRVPPPDEEDDSNEPSVPPVRKRTKTTPKPAPAFVKATEATVAPPSAATSTPPPSTTPTSQPAATTATADVQQVALDDDEGWTDELDDEGDQELITEIPYKRQADAIMWLSEIHIDDLSEDLGLMTDSVVLRVAKDLGLPQTTAKGKKRNIATLVQDILIRKEKTDRAASSTHRKNLEKDWHKIEVLAEINGEAQESGDTPPPVRPSFKQTPPQEKVKVEQQSISDLWAGVKVRAARVNERREQLFSRMKETTTGYQHIPGRISSEFLVYWPYIRVALLALIALYCGVKFYKRRSGRHESQIYDKDRDEWVDPDEYVRRRFQQVDDDDDPTALLDEDDFPDEYDLYRLRQHERDRDGKLGYVRGYDDDGNPIFDECKHVCGDKHQKGKCNLCNVPCKAWCKCGKTECKQRCQRIHDKTACNLCNTPCKPTCKGLLNAAEACAPCARKLNDMIASTRQLLRSATIDTLEPIVRKFIAALDGIPDIHTACSEACASCGALMSGVHAKYLALLKKAQRHEVEDICRKFLAELDVISKRDHATCEASKIPLHLVGRADSRMVRLQAFQNDQLVSCINGMAYHGGILTMKHFFTDFDDDTKIKVFGQAMIKEFTYGNLKTVMHVQPNQHHEMVWLKVGFPAGTKPVITVPGADDTVFQLVGYMQGLADTISYRAGTGRRTKTGLLETTIQTLPGDCGSCYINDRHEVVGFHWLGTDRPGAKRNTNYGVAVTGDLLEWLHTLN